MKNGDYPAMPLANGAAFGLTKREYFMAHAPTEPQPWFEPVMPERPVLPNRWGELNEEQRREWDFITETGGEPEDPAVADFIARANAARQALDNWNLELRRQRYLQWPAAWADALLAELEKSNDQ